MVASLLPVGLRGLVVGGPMAALFGATKTFTSPPDEARIQGLTYASIDKGTVRASWTRADVITTVIVGALIVTMYVYVSSWL